MAGELGRRIPTDDRHIRQYPLRALAPTIPDRVERTLPLPYGLRARMDQGREGSCVGWACSWMMSILNQHAGWRPFYDARWLYHEAQAVDEWAETPPEEGTSVRAALDVLRARGHVLIRSGKRLAPSLVEGVAENRWAQTVDELRACIAGDVPVVCGTNWYEGMDRPEQRGRDWWMPADNLGRVRGGHAWCVYAASDRREAFKMVNSWGLHGYPLTWVPYRLIERLLNEQGEATVVTDRIAP